MTIFLATNNKHKLQEVAEIAPELTVYGPHSAHLDFTFEETGNTFAENALGKAHALCKLLQDRQIHFDAVLADDSGICVDALDGRPGIYSARYGSDLPKAAITSDRDRAELLLQEMQGIKERSARYVCAAALVSAPQRFILCQDTLEGLIATEYSDGQGGFGYDPIFWLPQYACTAADITAEEKHAISHRGKAVRKAIAALKAQDHPQGDSK